MIKIPLPLLKELQRLKDQDQKAKQLEALIRAYRSEMENPVKDSVMVHTRRRQLFSAVED